MLARAGLREIQVQDVRRVPVPERVVVSAERLRRFREAFPAAAPEVSTNDREPPPFG
jgi:hypothetical protein